LNPLQAMGRAPSGERLERCRAARNWRDGAFHNEEPTTTMVRQGPLWRMAAHLLRQPPGLSPAAPLPARDTDWAAFAATPGPLAVWLGHSGYALRLDGRTVLVDPVLGGNAAPVSFAVGAFPGSDPWRAEDLPDVDLLLLTHDHYDHLDADTVHRIRDRVGRVVAPLGVGAHLEHWGYAPERVTELAWDETTEPFDGWRLTAVPARHFSGRGLQRANTLWAAFVLAVPGWKGYLGGDSGYGPHFARIGREHGPFDHAWMECGQYGRYWPLIHATPEESVRAAAELGARLAQPVHWGKFTLAKHPWDEPVRRFIDAARATGVEWTVPLPGQPYVPGLDRMRESWWEGAV
jgi:L-ascorbate metabolism protein UlaG (beta-lactamase superfamily)